MGENGGKKNLRFQNYPDTCELSIQLHTVTDHNGSGVIRIVSSLIDFVSHVLFSLLGMKIWERYMVALMDYM